jgi:hypothetical protein
MTSLSDLKKNSKKSLEQLITFTEGLNPDNKKKEFPKDPRFWTLTRDDAGNGYAVIRFLPPKDGEERAFFRYWTYFFKGPSGKTYSNDCLSSIGLPDPAKEYYKSLWNKGDPASIAEARAMQRSERYIANILVINDPANPENNGKVFLYRFPKKIFTSKIKPLMFPDEALGEEANNPTDFWTGQNFKLKVKLVGDDKKKYPNYDESSFMTPSQIAKTDEDIQAIYDSVYSLKEFQDPANYKSYDECKKRLNEVLSDTGEAPKTMSEVDTQMDRLVQKSSSPTTNSSKDDDDDGGINLDDLLADI